MNRIYYGPWGNEHRDFLLEPFGHALRDKLFDTCLYVVPTASLAADVRNRLMREVKGWTGKPVMTFDDLISMLLQKSGQPYHVIDSVAKERIMYHVMRQSKRIWDGKQVSQLAEDPGIVRS